MLDTIKLFIPGVERKPEVIDGLKERLVDATLFYNDKTGNGVAGHLRNLRVSLNCYGLFVEGSVPKYVYGENFTSPTLNDVKLMLDEVSETLGEDMYKASVTRLDIAKTLEVEQQPNSYYPYLGNSKYLKRLRQDDDSIVWKNNSRRLQMYDKIAEAKAKGNSIPGEWQGKYALRFEVRYLKDLKSQFSGSDLHGEDLINSDFFHQELSKRWSDAYHSIEKLGDDIELGVAKTKGQVSKQLEIIGAKSLGHEKLMKLVDDLKKASIKESSRLRSHIASLLQTGSLPRHLDTLDSIIRSVAHQFQMSRVAL